MDRRAIWNLNALPWDDPLKGHDGHGQRTWTTASPVFLTKWSILHCLGSIHVAVPAV